MSNVKLQLGKKFQGAQQLKTKQSEDSKSQSIIKALLFFQAGHYAIPINFVRYIDKLVWR